MTSDDNTLSLLRITAPHFCAGLETDSVCRRAAPILKYMVGWTQSQVRRYCRRKGWKIEIVE